ncbi:MAG: WG repeat-containing protein [Muribaculaceae bacterium]
MANKGICLCVSYDEDTHKYGYLDESGNWAIKPIFDGAREFSDNLAVVWENGIYMYINLSGEIAFEQTFKDCRTFWNGLAAVKINDKWGFIDNTGTLVIPAIFDWTSAFCNASYAEVSIDEKKGIIDRQGNWIAEPIYDLIDDVNFDGHLTVWKDNEEKELVIPYSHTKPTFE